MSGDHIWTEDSWSVSKGSQFWKKHLLGGSGFHSIQLRCVPTAMESKQFTSGLDIGSFVVGIVFK